MVANVPTFGLITKPARMIRSRIKQASVYTFGTLAGVMIATRGAFSPEVLVLAPLGTFLIFLAIYLLNDLSDLGVDAFNATGRPLPTHAVTKKETAILILFLNAGGIAISVFLGSSAFVVGLLEILLGILYSMRPFNFKDRFIIKTLTIGTGGALAILFGGVASRVVNVDLLFSSTMFLVYAFATSPLNDLGDYIGDYAQRRKTIPIVIGPQATIKLSIMMSLVPPIAALVFYETLNFNILAFAFLSLIAAWSVRLLLPLRGSAVNFANVRKNQRKMVFFYFLLQGAFVVGSLAL